MQRLVNIKGTQEVEAHLTYYTTASLSIFIRYASLDDLPCNVDYLPCMLSIKLLGTAKVHSSHICTNCDTALFKHLPHGTYKITAVIQGVHYCTTYTLASNSRIMLHALPTTDNDRECCRCCCRCEKCCEVRGL